MFCSDGWKLFVYTEKKNPEKILNGVSIMFLFKAEVAQVKQHFQ